MRNKMRLMTLILLMALTVGLLVNPNRSTLAQDSTPEATPTTEATAEATPNADATAEATTDVEVIEATAETTEEATAEATTENAGGETPTETDAEPEQAEEESPRGISLFILMIGLGGVALVGFGNILRQNFRADDNVE